MSIFIKKIFTLIINMISKFLKSAVIPIILGVAMILFFGVIAQVRHGIDFENTIEFVNESGEDIRITPIMSHNYEQTLWGTINKSWIKSNLFFQKQPTGMSMRINASKSLKLRSSTYPGFDALILDFTDGSKKISSPHYIQQGPTIFDPVIVAISKKKDLPDFPSDLNPLLIGEKIYVDRNSVDKLLTTK